MQATSIIRVVCLIPCIIVAFFLLVFSCPPSAVAQEIASHETTNEEAVRTVVSEYEKTWNDNDMTAWGELFTDDVDYVHRGGGWWKSNEENLEGHRRIHERLVEQNQAMTLELTVASITFLSSDIALIHVTSGWPDFEGGDEGLEGVMTMVMVQDGGEWRIRALQNTLASNPAP